MYKFIFITDSHFRGKNSISRKGDYYSECMSKLDEIISLSKKYKVDRVISGGDFFDSNLVSLNIVDEIVDKIEKGKIIWECIRGNHNEINGSPELSGASSLDHIFRRSKFIKHLTTIEEKYFRIVGYDYVFGIEEELTNEGLIAKEDEKEYLQIAILHAMITPKKLPNFYSLPCKDLKTNYDYILCGHYHKPFIVDNFINSGCIGRLKSDEQDIEPSVVLCEIDDSERVTFKYKIIKLKSVKPKEEIFDLEFIEQRKNEEINLNNFIEKLGDFQLQTLDIKGRLDFIAKEKKVDNEIIEDIYRRLK